MDSSSDSSPLRLPWELIERIISHSCEPKDSSNSKVIRNFAPVPLLRILPNLSEIKFIDTTDTPFFMVLNQPSLTCYQRLGTRIRTLSLSNLYFSMSIQFLRVLSAFSSLVHLSCSNVFIGKEGNQISLDVAKLRLGPRLRLLTLAIVYGGYCFQPGTQHHGRISVGALLLDSGLVQSTVESLTVEGAYRLSGHSLRIDMPRLRLLRLRLESEESGQTLTNGIAFLKDFQHPSKKEVILEIYEENLSFLAGCLARHAGVYEELERTLLEFSRARLVWILSIVPTSRSSLWVQEFGKLFPVLYKRGLLEVVPDKRLPTHQTRAITALAVSPDSKWAASGSPCGTVVLWDLVNGAQCQRWIPHGYNELTALAFSPNSQYLVSGAWGDSCLGIWDLGGGLPHVLEGHDRGIRCCAWSPRGDVIASGSRDGTVRLWDATTFEPLSVLQHFFKPATYMAFSADGIWLLTSSGGDCCLWDIASGNVRRFEGVTGAIAAAFNNANPSSGTLLAVQSPYSVVNLMGIEDGECVPGPVVLDCGPLLHGMAAKHVEFSPDGSRVLTVPRLSFSAYVMKIWDAHTGCELVQLATPNAISVACFSPCGRYVASASNDGAVRLWRASDGTCIAMFNEHKEKVERLFFSPDGKALVSGGWGGLVVIQPLCDVLLQLQDDQDP